MPPDDITPVLRLVTARQRMIMAVVAILTGPFTERRYAGSPQAETDFAEMAGAARDLVFAQERTTIIASPRRVSDA